MSLPQNSPPVREVSRLEKVAAGIREKEEANARLRRELAESQAENSRLTAELAKAKAALPPVASKVVPVVAPQPSNKVESLEEMEDRLGKETDPVKIVSLAREIDAIKAKKPPIR